jgi:hypothetical protein
MPEYTYEMDSVDSVPPIKMREHPRNPLAVKIDRWLELATVGQIVRFTFGDYDESSRASSSLRSAFPNGSVTINQRRESVYITKNE